MHVASSGELGENRVFEFRGECVDAFSLMGGWGRGGQKLSTARHILVVEGCESHRKPRKGYRLSYCNFSESKLTEGGKKPPYLWSFDER